MVVVAPEFEWTKEANKFYHDFILSMSLSDKTNKKNDVREDKQDTKDETKDESTDELDEHKNDIHIQKKDQKVVQCMWTTMS